MAATFATAPAPVLRLVLKVVDSPPSVIGYVGRIDRIELASEDTVCLIALVFRNRTSHSIR